MKIENLSYDTLYEGNLDASIDWVAGGNFDGYITQTSLYFIEEGSIVIWRRTVLDQSRYDGEAEDLELHGKFREADKKTLTCTFKEFEIRGKILGNKHELIAFAYWEPREWHDKTCVFRKKESV